MTSRNLFPDLLRENKKRRLWPLALSIVCAIFSLPVLGVLAMEIWSERLIEGGTVIADVQASFYNTVAGIGNIAVFFCATGLALIFGINSMSYLHNKGKTDLYGSLPVKRTQLFGAAYLNGLLFFAVPFLIAQAVTVVIGTVRGFFPLSHLPGTLLSSVYVMIFYFSIYTLVCLSAVLSGNTIVSVALSGVILFIAPVSYLAYESYATVFFRSYYMDPDGKIWRYLSPVLTYIWIAFTKISAEFEKNSTEFSGSAVFGAVLMLATGIAALLITVLLIKKRPSESAGHALSFKWTRPVFKIVLMVTGSMLIALLFYEISAAKHPGWLIFGFIAGILIIHAVVEIVCEFDFKAMFRHPLSFIAGAALAALIILSFIFDFFGYDSYLPAASAVSSAALSSYDLQPSITYNDPERPGYYISNDEYRFKNMYINDIDDVLAISKKGVEFNREARKKALFSHSDNVENEARYSNINVLFRMNDGRKIYRSYYVEMTDEEVFDAYSKIYGTWEYKSAVYPVLDANADDLGQMRLMTEDSTHTLFLSEEEKDSLLRAYRLDMTKFKGDSLKDEIPCDRILFTKPLENNVYDNTRDYDMIVYPSFTRTLKLLKEIRSEKGLQKNDIISVDVYCYDTELYDYNRYTVKYENPGDKEEIDELMSDAIRSDFFREADVFMKDLSENERGYSMEVTFSDPLMGEGSYGNCEMYTLPEGSVPGFLEGSFSE